MGSADGGHYFSLINVERNGENNTLIENNDGEKKYKWLKFNDSHVSIFDINDIEKECFGGAKKGSGYNYESFQNAYMLIYERKKKSPIRILYEEKDIKENNVDKKSENDVEINKDNRKGIKKEYDLFKKNPKVDENNLYKKLFKDEEKNEYYKYIPYYNIDKLVPDLETGKITAIIVPGGSNKIANFFSSVNDIVIKWEDIKCIGDDLILVEIL